MSGGMAKNSLLLTGELFDTATATIRATQVGWLGLFHEQRGRSAEQPDSHKGQTF
jgi:hypothetical protein